MNIDIIRKRAVLIGFVLFIGTAIGAFFDPAGNDPAIEQSLARFELEFFGDLTSWFSLAIGLIYIASSILFYWNAWPGKATAIRYFWGMYISLLSLTIFDWTAQASLGIFDTLSGFSCAADGAAFALILIETKRNATQSQVASK